MTVVAVQAFTIQRANGISLMLRALPDGRWQLREYDANGDELMTLCTAIAACRVDVDDGLAGVLPR